MRLVQELLLLTLFLLFAILALIINLHFFSKSPNSETETQKEILIAQPLKTNQTILGKQLFKANCAACHNRNMKDDLAGPALGNVQKRWASNDVSIFDFIRNSQAVIKSGNAYARALYGKWKPTEMPSFPNLKDEEIEAILNFIEEQYSY